MSRSRLFTDKASGKDTQRPELERLLAFAREGDTVVVHSMDRLARNLDNLRLIVQKLTKRGVRIEFVKENLTFTGEDSPLANLMLSVMGAFAEFERALIRERQREGIALAKQRGAYRGRKKSLSLEQAAQLRQARRFTLTETPKNQNTAQSFQRTLQVGHCLIASGPADLSVGFCTVAIVTPPSASGCSDQPRRTPSDDRSSAIQSVGRCRLLDARAPCRGRL